MSGVHDGCADPVKPSTATLACIGVVAPCARMHISGHAGHPPARPSLTNTSSSDIHRVLGLARVRKRFFTRWTGRGPGLSDTRRVVIHSDADPELTSSTTDLSFPQICQTRTVSASWCGREPVRHGRDMPHRFMTSTRVDQIGGCFEALMLIFSVRARLCTRRSIPSLFIPPRYNLAGGRPSSALPLWADRRGRVLRWAPDRAGGDRDRFAGGREHRLACSEANREVLARSARG